MPYGNSSRGASSSHARTKESKSAAATAQKKQLASKQLAQAEKRTAAQQKAEQQRANDKSLQEQKLVSTFLSELTKDSGKVCYGVEQTMEALEAGAIKTLIVSKNCPVMRWVLKGKEGREEVKFTVGEDWGFVGEDGEEPKVLERRRWVEWIGERNWEYGARLKVIEGRSREGKEFLDGYGGICGMLRWNFRGEGEWFEEGELEES